MLERATSCLKIGVAGRDSTKCLRSAPRSSRLLHSTFWKHGAGDLDLPPWALPTTSQHGCKKGTTGRKRLNSVESDLLQQSHAPPESPFLDFLYPPAALAWLQKHNAQQTQRWERRNARRLPEGFVVASREYSSHSQAQPRPAQMVGFLENHVDDHQWNEQDFSPDDKRTAASVQGVNARNEENKSHRGISNLSHASSRMMEQRDENDPLIIEQGLKDNDRPSDLFSADLWANSPGEFAKTADFLPFEPLQEADVELEPDLEREQKSEQGPAESGDIVQDLYSIIKFGKVEDPARRETLVSKAQYAFRAASEANRTDSRLAQALLEYLASHPTDTKIHVTTCQSCFESIPEAERSFEAYRAAISIMASRNRLKVAFDIHREALRNLENGHQLTRILFKQALERSQWNVALEVAVQLHQHFKHNYRSSQIRVFWLHVSEIPQLLRKAIQLNKQLHYNQRFQNKKRVAIKQTVADPDREKAITKICATLYKEALAQEFVRNEGQTSFGDESLLSVPKSIFRPLQYKVKDDSAALSAPDLPIKSILALMHEIPDLKDQGAELLETLLTSIVRNKTGAQYVRFHQLATIMYDWYRKTPGVVPSEKLFMLWLKRLMEVREASTTVVPSRKDRSILRLVQEWKRCRGHVSRDGVHHLLRFYAHFGEVEEYDRWLQYLQSTFPDYEDQSDVLWTMIDVYSRRTDLDGAQQAFAKVRRITSEHGEVPNLKCWNVLLTAHSRADDLEGALTNLENLVTSGGLTPDEYSIHPVLELMAERGDVEGAVDLLRQYGDVFDVQMTTTLLHCLLLAHVRNGDIATAEDKLRQGVRLVHRGEIRGSLTGCFNVILLGYALRRDLAGTSRTYRWMQDANIRLDAGSYAAMMQALIMHRRTNDAASVLLRHMARDDIKPTSLHYALLVAGFHHNGQQRRALRLYEAMVQAGHHPTPSANVAYLKAKAMEEEREHGQIRTDDHSAENVPLEGTIATLKQFLEIDVETAARPTQPFPALGFAASDTINAIPAAYHGFLIELLGRRCCFDAVQELYRQYMEQVDKRKGSQEAIPLTMLAALASAHYSAREHDQVDACWELAKAEADRVARLAPIPPLAPPRSGGGEVPKPSKVEVSTPTESSQSIIEDSVNQSADVTRSADLPPLLQTHLAPDGNAPTPRTSRLAPARRHVLTRILRFYLRSKQARDQPIEALNTVTELTRQGYTLDHLTWNIFIRTLVQRSPPLTLLAFILTERYLTPNFPGWKKGTGNVWAPKPFVRERGLQNTDRRAYFLAPGHNIPRYDTLVALAGALLTTRRSEAVGYSDVEGGVSPELKGYVGSIEKVERLAPHTVAIVNEMPRTHDRVQDRALGKFGID